MFNHKDLNCGQNRRKTGLLGIIAFFSVLGMLAATVYAFITRKQNIKYKEKLIEISNDFPITPEQEVELAEIRKRQWATDCPSVDDTEK